MHNNNHNVTTRAGSITCFGPKVSFLHKASRRQRPDQQICNNRHRDPDLPERRLRRRGYVSVRIAYGERRCLTVQEDHRLDCSARDVPTGGDKVSVAGNVPCQPADLDVFKLWAAQEFVILDDSKKNFWSTSHHESRGAAITLRLAKCVEVGLLLHYLARSHRKIGGAGM